ncbi:S-methyl-5-thioribose-1-phosphate isomerase [Dictyobacter formicarum]|uniref:Methylthioribose-1-phosphate isomerase n=1 Tax=Dictyobacter formicarum TaxID=2778368 RepID=A0ABQ3VFJ0_9CHLR|nr:S-methyl-5-thioribose-1-phosphate isomerase [Dictyobacter formicarum]GHO84583.1 methylthioribose-1-phosphate isomerase [Dictyobacter formicarum]
MNDNLFHSQVRTVWWEEDPPDRVQVGILDQSLLPQQIVTLHLQHEQQVAEAIASLRVRGAPAIGVTAAFGIALAAARLLAERQASQQELTLAELNEHVYEVAQLLCRTRPTAVNLFWATERMQRVCLEARSTRQLVTLLKEEAQAIAAEDAQACWQMGVYGAELIADGDTLLTHCNAGALATTGIGTALAPIYVAARSGKHLHVLVDETRPILQGARLTAWELQQEGVPLTLITDNMAGHFMRQGDIRAIFVGADRITANGDVANKIGTYSLAVLAHAHQIPLYVVAPCSTIDLSLPSGDQIPIEQRRSEEVTTLYGTPIAPAGVTVANPAFDVTPHPYIAAIITEKGIVRPPYRENLRGMNTEH